jgi:hypothetical protein
MSLEQLVFEKPVLETLGEGSSQIVDQKKMDREIVYGSPKGELKRGDFVRGKSYRCKMDLWGCSFIEG